jgi:hypothetical protein
LRSKSGGFSFSLKNSAREKWKNGKMEKWKNGKMGRAGFEPA